MPSVRNTIWQQAGLTTEALQRELDEIRGELMRERFGNELPDKLARQHGKLIATRGDGA